ADPAKTHPVLSAANSATLRQDLEAVVTAPGATGHAAAVPGYRVAGKTGTGLEVKDGKYAPGEVASFIGMAPAEAPRYVSAVLADPAGADAAALAGVPALVVHDPRAGLGEVAAAVYDRPSEKLTVIGITGTAGKTSTAYLVESGLRAAGRVTGLIGTVETRLGGLVVDSARTTPEATDLHAALAVAVERGVDAVVMEVSSHALALGRVEG